MNEDKKSDKKRNDDEEKAFEKFLESTGGQMIKIESLEKRKMNPSWKGDMGDFINDK